MVSKIISVTDSWDIYCNITLRWMPLVLVHDKSTLVQVLASSLRPQDISWAIVDLDLYQICMASLVLNAAITRSKLSQCKTEYCSDSPCKLWGVCHVYFGENWLHYNCTTLFSFPLWWCQEFGKAFPDNMKCTFYLPGTVYCCIVWI